MFFYLEYRHKILKIKKHLSLQHLYVLIKIFTYSFTHASFFFYILFIKWVWRKIDGLVSLFLLIGRQTKQKICHSFEREKRRRRVVKKKKIPIWSYILHFWNKREIYGKSIVYLKGRNRLVSIYIHHRTFNYSKKWAYLFFSLILSLCTYAQSKQLKEESTVAMIWEMLSIFIINFFFFLINIKKKYSVKKKWPFTN